MRPIGRGKLLLSITSLTVVILACAFGQSLRRVQTYPRGEDEDFMRDIAVADGYVFVAMGRDGLLVLDAANAIVAPIKVDLETPADAVPWVSVTENYAYIIDLSSGLHVVDISDLSKPVILGSYKPDTPSIDAAIQFPYVFLTTGGGGLHILDVSEPTALKRVGIYNLPVDNLKGSIYDVAVSGKYAYITLTDYAYDDFVEVLDISNPATPIKVGAVRVDLARNIVVKGSYAFVTNGRGLQILDVSKPQSPTVISSSDTPNVAEKLEVEGDHVYISDLFGVEVVDISDIHSPRRVSYRNLPQVQDVAVVGDYIYVADRLAGLIIFEHP
jgi:hypothetical protein